MRQSFYAAIAMLTAFSCVFGQPGDDDIFQPPLASPSEPASLIRYAGDSNMDFGMALPLAIYPFEEKAAWRLELRPGFLSRFEKTGSRFGLKSADFRIGVASAWQNGNWSVRAEVFHISSHRGADIESPPAADQFTYSREAAQFLFGYGRKGNWRIYAGPSLLIRTHPDAGRWTLQTGAEWFPAKLAHSFLHPYLAADIQSRQEAHWNVNAAFEPGIMFAAPGGRPSARLALWIYDGQVPFGQYSREREKQVGIHFIVDTGVSLAFLAGRLFGTAK